MRGQFWSILEYGANSNYSEEGVALITLHMTFGCLFEMQSKTVKQV